MTGKHDSLVKALFTNLEDAASALASALPEAIAKRIDWSSLKHANLSLIDPKLREFYSDIVFTANVEGHEVFLYVLHEHQSTSDRFMAFRMLRYALLLVDAFLRQHPKATLLPAVLPFVLYNGELQWTAPISFADIIDLPEDFKNLLGEHLPRFRFFLDDLSTVDDAALRARALTTMMLAGLVLLKKAPYSTDLVADLRGWVDVFRRIAAAPNGVDALRLLFEYISVTSEADPDNVREFARLIGPAAENVYMTAAEKLAEQGREEGRKEGREEGREAGRKEGQADLLVRQLTLRFGQLPQDVAVRIHAASDAELALWAERVLTAPSLDEVFRGG